MDTKDKTPPVGTIEEDLSAEEKAVHEAEAQRLAGLKNGSTPDDKLPKVQAENPG